MLRRTFFRNLAIFFGGSALATQKAQADTCIESATGRRFEIYKGVSREYNWRFLSSNGRVIADGGRYNSLRSCQNAIELMKSSDSAPVNILC